MVTFALGPRILLRRLREVMAKPGTTQNKLDRTVTLIAANVVAEVCSLYIVRDGGRLELYATEGLNRTAVHHTFLQMGEGLVGTIASEACMLNLADAQSHPAFKYLPQTGEEIYSSFLGVPILRGGLAIGVLVVQNRTARRYSEEEEEALQTTAMVLAELIASGELRTEGARDGENLARAGSRHLTGQPLSAGIGLGHAVLHQPRVSITNLIAESVADEQIRLEEAINGLREQVDRLISSAGPRGAGEHHDVLETVRMFAHDQGWLRRMREAVSTGLTAEAAVERVQTDNRARMLRQSDPALRERMYDLDDLGNRMLRILSGERSAAAGALPRDAIIVARSMGPAELLDYDRSRVRGLILEEAGQNSHVAIVARALNLPAAGQAFGILDHVDTGTAVIVDGGSGEVHVRPSAHIEDAYGEKVRFYARRQARYKRLRDKPAVTRDGVNISLSINAGLQVDLPHLLDSGADGIGLYRTELQFMLAKRFPRQAEQTRHYKTVLDTAAGRPVVFRSLDIGSDKMLPYFRSTREDNPAMGWRAIRIALDRSALLKLQVRALLHAAAGRELKLMFPMIAEADEFARARALVEKEQTFFAARGYEQPSRVAMGAMIEVPSAAWQIDDILTSADFISIGSNDLMQFLFAFDRSHPRLQNRYDPLSPVALRVIAHVIEAARARAVPANLCGEMAGIPLEAMALIGVGLRAISMAPAAIGPVKTMIHSLDAAHLADHMRDLLRTPQRSLRPALESYAERHAVAI